ncbi:hypothetical protein TUBRATIS_11150 [Tubulinosema ratisbonensis]|uniref:Uncharacterized protein n=1 Tax=Tubulinosema ratisbonensis TaxID=291195 RepID=A0A437AMG5_9MICR|nr:hypothetical protein TUBRATIS_11150 [Tubulinosema ratisbonensis]
MDFIYYIIQIFAVINLGFSAIETNNSSDSNKNMIYTIQAFKTCERTIESFRNFINIFYPVLCMTDKEIQKKFQMLQNFLESTSRLTFGYPLKYGYIEIHVKEAFNTTLKDYLFDIKEIFAYFDAKSKFKGYKWNTFVPEDKPLPLIFETFFDFLWNKNKIDVILFMDDLDLDLKIQVLAKNFQNIISNEKLNSKKFIECRSLTFLSFIYNYEYLNLSLDQLYIILRYHWYLLLSDPGYEIVKILFPEIICLIKQAITIEKEHSTKKIHFILGLITLRVQSNLHAIKREIHDMHISNIFSITQSKFLNNFIFKTRLYVTIMILSTVFNNLFKKYYVFLTFLSYIRLSCPSIFESLPYDEIICANVSLEESIKIYNLLFFEIELYKNSESVNFSKLVLKPDFFDQLRENNNPIILFFGRNNIFCDEEIKFVFRNIREFRDMLCESTFNALLSFFANQNTEMF